MTADSPSGSKVGPGCGRARQVLLVAGAYLVTMYAIIAIVDVFDAGGLRSLLGRDEGMPMWFHIFGEAMPTEWLQWTALGIAGLVSAAASGIAYMRSEKRLATFLGVMSIAFVLLLIEDAGNPSHAQALLLQQLLGDSTMVRHGGRLPVFLVLAATPLYAMVRYWSELKHFTRERSLYVIGMLFYAVAAISSVPLNILFDFYERAGSWFLTTVLSDRLIPIRSGYFRLEEPTAVVFMDFVYEESVELVAAAILLAASLKMLCRSTNFALQLTGQGNSPESDDVTEA